MDKRRICRLRDIYRAIAMLENQFSRQFGLNINEAMLLCQLQEKPMLSSGEIAEALGMTPSNASKVIVSVEKKKFIRRDVSRKDKRQMNFTLTKQGEEKLQILKCGEIELPEMLQNVVD